MNRILGDGSADRIHSMSAVPQRFRAMAGALLLAGLASLPFALIDSGVIDPRVQGWLAAGWLLLAAGTLLLAPRSRVWGFPVVLGLTTLLVAASAAATTRGQVQVVEGFGILVVAVLAADFLPTPLFRGLVAFAGGVYVLVLVLNQQLLGPWVAVLIVVVIAGVSEMTHRRANAMMRAAMTDPLTGALNRQGLVETAPAVRSVAQRAGLPTSVAVIDLDGFKLFNDTHGHSAGDDLLMQLVRGWMSDLRPSDLIARIGGDEFVLVLPGSSPEEAAHTVDRLHASSPALWTGGLALWREGEDTFDVVNRADQFMYKAKRAKR